MSSSAHARFVLAALATMCAFGEAGAESAGPSADEAAFRALYKELIEINTTRSVGNCTRAAEAMRAHLLAAGIPAGGHADPRAARGAERWGAGRSPARHGQVDQADPAARAHRCRRGEARGLDARSVQAGRGKRLVLRARRERRQVDGGDLHGQPDPLQEGRLQAAARHQAGADLRRGNGGRGPVRQRALARADPTRSAERRVRDQRRARAASSTRMASRWPCRSRRARRSTRTSRSRPAIPAATARCPKPRQRDRAPERGPREARRVPVSDRR